MVGFVSVERSHEPVVLLPSQAISGGQTGVMSASPMKEQMRILFADGESLCPLLSRNKHVASSTRRREGPVPTILSSRQDQDGSQKIGNIGKILSVESLEMEKGDDRAFERRTATRVDGGGREGLPDNILTNVGGNEQRDGRAQALSLLQELIQNDGDDWG